MHFGAVSLRVKEHSSQTGVKQKKNLCSCCSFSFGCFRKVLQQQKGMEERHNQQVNKERETETERERER